MTAIAFQNVSYAYEKGNTILEDISFQIQPLEKVGLIGENGAGKSTMMKLLTGLVLGEGTILVDGMEMTKEHLSAIRQKAGFVMQNSDHQMFMPTVYEDMAFAPRNYGVTQEEIDMRIDEVLTQLDISYLKNQYNHKLSGGEKRMAAIATILVNQPEIVLMDEPTSALDPINRRKIIQTICALPKTCIITSHDLDMIYDTCERVMVLKDGKILADGPKDLLKDASLLASAHLELPLSFQSHNE